MEPLGSARHGRSPKGERWEAANQRASLGVNGTDCQWSRWEASDMDGRTREGEPSGKKANQAVT